MKNILFIASFLCAIISSCNKSTESKDDENKTTSEHISTEVDVHIEVSQIQQSLPKAVDNEQNVDAEKLALNEAEKRVDQVNFRNAKLVKNPLRKNKKMRLEEIKKINQAVKDKPLVSADPNLLIATVAEAFERVNISLSMATAPKVFAEDEKYYYFSGGLSVDQVDDFSSGIRISKNGGAIHVWSYKH